MFYIEKKNNVFNTAMHCTSIIPQNIKKIYLPLEVDTEFQEPHYPYKKDTDRQRVTISVQIKSINKNYKPMFFLHRDMQKLSLNTGEKNTDYIETDFAIVDYLIKNGYDVKLHNEYEPVEKNIYIDIIGHTLIADIERIFEGNLKKKIQSLIYSSNNTKEKITHDRHLKCITKKGYQLLNYVSLNYNITINNTKYNIFIGTMDMGAIRGNISYEELCYNTKVKLISKQLISQKEKQNMLEVFKEKPEIFKEYAQGDLFSYEAFQNHIEQMKKLYTDLDIPIDELKPCYTIGSTVNKMVESLLIKELKLTSKTQLYEHIKYATTKHFTRNINSTSIYLAKTTGGRCYNNRVTDVSIKSILADIDIESCYGKGLAHQYYPIGKPVILEYDLHNKYNQYLTLKHFLNKYRNDLIYGLWYCRISTKEKLNFDQDFFPSWYPPENLQDIARSETTEIIENDNEAIANDQTIIFKRTLNLSPLQAEGLEWIEKTLSPSEREDFLNKCIVISAAFYPKTLECQTKEEYIKKIEKHKGRSTSEIQTNISGKTIIKKINQDCFAWYKINIGNVLIKKLLEEQPMNKFIKLIINTIYGDLVSPYFMIGNIIVSNNITARARAMAWYMEKALHGTQTITDGCIFEVNRVIKSRYNLSNKKYQKIKIEGNQKDLSFGYLMNKKYKEEELDEIKKEELAIKAKEHIQRNFRKINVINLYDLEVKHIFTGLATHGTSNYQIIKKNEIITTKMRGYKNKAIPETTQQSSQKIKEWLNDIYKNPSKVKRPEPFIIDELIKTNGYRKEIEKYKKININPGNTNQKVRTINECPLTMFSFQSYEQYKSWKKQYEQLRRRHMQTYEANYTDEKYINYKEMIIEIQKKIDEGEMKYQLAKIHNYKDHPMKEKYYELKEYIEEHQKEIAGVMDRELITIRE